MRTYHLQIVWPPEAIDGVHKALVGCSQTGKKQPSDEIYFNPLTTAAMKNCDVLFPAPAPDSPEQGEADAKAYCSSQAGKMDIYDSNRDILLDLLDRMIASLELNPISAIIICVNR